MTNYKATPDQWAYQEHWAVEDGDAACLLELRARVEALELGAGIRDAVAAELERNYPAKPDGSLMDQVVNAIYDNSYDNAAEAGAAIRQVAAWIRSEYPSFQGIAAAMEAELDDD